MQFNDLFTNYKWCKSPSRRLKTFDTALLIIYYLKEEIRGRKLKDWYLDMMLVDNFVNFDVAKSNYLDELRTGIPYKDDKELDNLIY